MKMHIGNMVMFLPRALISKFLDMRRIDIDAEGKQAIVERGLYYLTKDEETANNIRRDQYLEPTRGIIKSYVPFFCGVPDIESYMRNSRYEPNENPYLNPTRVQYAIKVSPKNAEGLKNYKMNRMLGNSIICEGYCVVPKEEIKTVALVLDFERDPGTRAPIRDENGRFKLAFREASEEELSEDRKTYNAQQDYIEFMEKEKNEGKWKAKVNEFIAAVKFYVAEAQRTFGNIKFLKRKLEQFMTPMLDMPVDNVIQDILRNYKHDRKNPYRDPKFAKAAAFFLSKGFSQLDLTEELEKLTTGPNGEYFRKKYAQIDKKPIIPRGIHGINHNNRVAIFAMIIAQNKKGVLDNDKDDRTKDILLTAAYYHDIGRKKGIRVDNKGVHGEYSAIKVGKMENLLYANGKKYSDGDKLILQAVIDAHEGWDDEMDDMCDQYGIKNEDREYVKTLMRIIKDADALDRVRTDLNYLTRMETDLDPQFLRTDASKQLLDAAYQLEELVRRVSFDRILAYKTDKQKDGGIKRTAREQFVEGVRYVEKQVQQAGKRIRTLINRPRPIQARFTGTTKKIKEMAANILGRRDREGR